jgi:hypothetical protein
VTAPQRWSGRGAAPSRSRDRESQARNEQDDLAGARDLASRHGRDALRLSEELLADRGHLRDGVSKERVGVAVVPQVSVGTPPILGDSIGRVAVGVNAVPEVGGCGW